MSFEIWWEDQMKKNESFDIFNRLKVDKLDCKTVAKLAYIEGLVHATVQWAIWQEGQQYIGVMREPLQKVIDEIRREGKL